MLVPGAAAPSIPCANGDVAADRGCDNTEVRRGILVAGGLAHLPATRGKCTQISVAPDPSRKRNLTERCVKRLQHLRRFARRFGPDATPEGRDKLRRNRFGTVALGSIRLGTRFLGAERGAVSA